ncbi:CDP-glucose 4,6-dehydratase [Rhizobium deserti]|uniref:CDP-glucose 4,6-dehydratase n=1 Tax=Rhizobium deserti TaxID=2547961 RepID=A0A4R5UN35_9HYPH|nr:CDP-glucose 4,6-dehydratase [Rhizobium deserti]TDK39144.1 CDP-glucose 4,6-dehydratase [Rhizobium deserti]
MRSDFLNVYAGQTVLVTGHSGFKGSWLTTWLHELGAKVIAASLPPDQGEDSLFAAAKIEELCDGRWLDIRDADGVFSLVEEIRPRIIFHLAAQALVHRGYREPLFTFGTNIMGAANVLEAARQTSSVEAVVFVTSDKVYDNREWLWAYRENDALGGLDPYSASKGAAELVARPYMTVLKSEGDRLRVATGRGGNVIGGGDWSADRIVPDVVRALRKGEALVLRRPDATRPWQHVLELCCGYLTLGARLLNGSPARSMTARSFIGSYNFGPDRANEMPVRELTKAALQAWGDPSYPVEFGPAELHEATYLRVDSSKSQFTLGWKPHLTFQETIEWTMNWYSDYCNARYDARSLMLKQIDAYSNLYLRETQ